MTSLREQAKAAATAPPPLDEWNRLLPWGIEERVDAASDVWEQAVRELLEVIDNALFPHLNVPEYIATRDKINRAKAAIR